MLFAAYLGLNLIAFLLKSPIGSNANRLFLIGGMPLLWLAANVSRRRSKLVVMPLLAAAMAIQLGPAVRNAYSAWSSEAGSPAYWRPAIRFLDTHPSTGYRVEAVSTWGHWDAYYLARTFPLARGWYRQDDFPQNTVLYGDDLTAATYQAWLRSLGVRYVLLPDTALDYSSLAEQRLLTSGRSGLQLVGRTAHWRFYELRDATPIVSAPRRHAGPADPDELGAGAVRGLRPGHLHRARALQPVLAAHVRRRLRGAAPVTAWCR